MAVDTEGEMGLDGLRMKHDGNIIAQGMAITRR